MFKIKACLAQIYITKRKLSRLKIKDKGYRFTKIYQDKARLPCFDMATNNWSWCLLLQAISSNLSLICCWNAKILHCIKQLWKQLNYGPSKLSRANEKHCQFSVPLWIVYMVVGLRLVLWMTFPWEYSKLYTADMIL